MKLWNFFKKREEDLSQYPTFWQEYAQKNKADATPVRYVVFDTETTGFNFAKDRILSIGAVDIVNQRIDLKNAFELFLDQDTFNPEAVAIHGIRQEHIYMKHSEKKAIQHFIKYIGNSILVGHHVFFDVKMINAALDRMQLPPLYNKMLDTNTLFKATKIINPLLRNDKNYSLDDICNDLNISMHDRHNAAGDAFLTALAFLKIKNKLEKQNKSVNNFLFTGD